MTKKFAGIKHRENKSLSALQRLGNRDLRQKLKRKGKDRRAGVEAREIPRVEPMTDVKNSPFLVRFGAFEVSFESRELRKHGMRIQLEEKPFQILETLIESAGQVVPRKALCEKLWPDTYVAFDHSLNTAVNKLRNVLGDLAQSPRFIETRPRLGYRFVAPVERPNDDRPGIAGRAANGPEQQLGHRSERQTRRLVMATSVRDSSRPEQVPGSSPQAKNCQSAP